MSKARHNPARNLAERLAETRPSRYGAVDFAAVERAEQLADAHHQLRHSDAHGYEDHVDLVHCGGKGIAEAEQCGPDTENDPAHSGHETGRPGSLDLGGQLALDFAGSILEISENRQYPLADQRHRLPPPIERIRDAREIRLVREVQRPDDRDDRPHRSGDAHERRLQWQELFGHERPHRRKEPHGGAGRGNPDDKRREPADYADEPLTDGTLCGGAQGVDKPAEQRRAA